MTMLIDTHVARLMTGCEQAVAGQARLAMFGAEAPPGINRTVVGGVVLTRLGTQERIPEMMDCTLIVVPRTHYISKPAPHGAVGIGMSGILTSGLTDDNLWIKL